MKALNLIGAVFASASLENQSRVQCERRVEMVIVQDATASYADIGDKLSPHFDSMVKRINERMGEAFTAVTLFCDKPVPFRGIGEGRGAGGVIDMCYNNDFTKPLSNNSSGLKKAYDQIYDLNCEGGDYPEASLEALMYAAMDPKIQWSPADKVYTDDLKRIVKVVVLVTDDHPHYAGDAASGIKHWNPLKAGEHDDYPHFFDKGFYKMNGIVGSKENEEKYAKLVELHKLEVMTAAQRVKYNELLAWLGPAVYDDPIEHPGTFEVYKDCKLYEYPTLEMIGKVLRRENVLPVVLLDSTRVANSSKKLCEDRGFQANNREKFLECLTAIYTSDFRKAGIENFIVASYNDANDLVTKIIDKVDKLSRDVSCPDPTTPSPPTEPTSAETTTTETTTEPTTETTTERTTEPTTETTTEPTTETTIFKTTTERTTEPTTETTTETTTTETEITTTASTTSSDTPVGSLSSSITWSTSNTTIPPVVPVVPAGGSGSNTPVIAGATGGAAAGAAALAGVLYKKFGTGLLGHSTPGDLNVGEQVETPETPVDREAFEEVTTDMFQ